MKKRFALIVAVLTLALSAASDARGQWVQTSLNGNNSPIYCFAVNDSNLFAGTAYGVFRSTDSGTMWAKVNNGMIEPEYVQDLAIDGTNLFSASDGGGVSLSTDNGENWTGGSNGSSDVFAVAVLGTNLFAGFVGPGAGIYVSTDNGIVWNPSWNPFDSCLTTGWIETFVVSGTNLFAGTVSDGILLSTDTGSSWNAVNSGLTEDGVLVYALLASDTSMTSPMLFAGTAIGVFLSTNNGSNWTEINNGLSTNNNI
jgi:hypothetical protein